MPKKADNKVMKQMYKLWNQKPDRRQHLSDDEINNMLSSDEKTDKLYKMMKGKVAESHNQWDALKNTIGVCNKHGIEWKKCPMWKKVDMNRIKKDRIYRDEIADELALWTNRKDLFPYSYCNTPEHFAAHDGEWDALMGEGKKPIKINESQLRSIIAESVRRVLKEKQLNPKEASYRLMVMLGTIQDEMEHGNAESVSLNEINELYEYASILNEYFSLHENKIEHQDNKLNEEYDMPEYTNYPEVFDGIFDVYTHDSYSDAPCFVKYKGKLYGIPQEYWGMLQNLNDIDGRKEFLNVIKSGKFPESSIQTISLVGHGFKERHFNANAY